MRAKKYMQHAKPQARKLKKQTRDAIRQAEARQRLAAVAVASMVQGAIDTARENLELRSRAKQQAGKVYNLKENKELINFIALEDSYYDIWKSA